VQIERTAIEQRREQDYHDYREYNRFQMSEDEVTFAGEAIRAYKKSEIPFQRLSDDFVTFNPDGTFVSLVETMRGAELHYEELANKHPEFWWQVARTKLENSHIEHALMMQPGDIRLVISDCPEEELKKHGKNVFGYQGGDIKLGFLQLFYVDRQGDLTIYGHSFEKNDPQALDDIYAMFGKTRNHDAWTLAQPIDDHIADFDPETLLDRAIATYDSSLSRTRGGKWFAGRANVAHDEEEANSFVRRQTDLLAAHLQKLELVGPKSTIANTLRYDFAVAIRRRYEGKTNELSYKSADVELASEGAASRDAGESVDGCGLSLSAENSTEKSLSEIGMQTLHNGETLDACMQCPYCKKTGVLVSGINGRVFYTCINPRGCGATTLPEYLQKQSLEKGVTPKKAQEQSNYTKYSDSEKQGALREKYGRYATLQQKIGTGTARLAIINVLTGEEYIDESLSPFAIPT